MSEGERGAAQAKVELEDAEAGNRTANGGDHTDRRIQTKDAAGRATNPLPAAPEESTHAVVCAIGIPTREPSPAESQQPATATCTTLPSKPMNVKDQLRGDETEASERGPEPETMKPVQLSREYGSTETLRSGPSPASLPIGPKKTRPIVRLTMEYREMLETCQSRKTMKRPFRVSPPSFALDGSGGASLGRMFFGNDFQRKDTEELPLEEKRGPNNGGYDDENDDYVFLQGEVWLDRYTVQKPLGRGSFGTVVQAFDADLQRTVAIKIIKSRESFMNQGKIELRILKYVNQKDPEDTNCIVRLFAHFVFRNHLCLVYEVLSYNLYELLRMGHFAGMNLSLVRKFGFQILLALRFLARDDIKVLHCDLKPENILLRDLKKAKVKVIDFGSSCFIDERAYMYIQSRFYRAPEVILGVRYSCEIDMWSLGCILAELYTGQPLFCGQSEVEQIDAIQEVLGPLPPTLVSRGHAEKLSKLKGATLDGTIASANATEPVASPNRALRSILASKVALPLNGRPAPVEAPSEFASFVELVEGMLRLDPQHRMKPVEAFQHPFFRTMTTASQTESRPPPPPEPIPLLPRLLRHEQ